MKSVRGSLICVLMVGLMAQAHAVDVRSSQASPDAWKLAKIVRSTRPKENLQELHWLTESVEVMAKLEGAVFVPYVSIEGTFKREDWVLVKGESPLVLDDKTRRFSIEMPLVGEVTSVHLYGIGPLGEVEDEKLVIAFAGFADFGTKLRELRAIRPAFQTGLGVSAISYTQTGIEDFAENGVTFKAGYQGILEDPWDYGFSTYFTVLTFGSSVPNVQARYFGLNARMGYVVPFLKEPWRLSLMAGAYFTTMFVTKAAFGYQYIVGPMFFPVLRRIISSRDTISGYFKFSPISNGIGFLSLDSRELAAGLAWSRQEPDSRPYSISLDFADTSIVIPGAQSQTRSISLGGSVGW